jgi:hypothetical protein
LDWTMELLLTSTCPISLSSLASTSRISIGKRLLSILAPNNISCFVLHNLFNYYKVASSLFTKTFR